MNYLLEKNKNESLKNPYYFTKEKKDAFIFENGKIISTDYLADTNAEEDSSESIKSIISINIPDSSSSKNEIENDDFIKSSSSSVVEIKLSPSETENLNISGTDTFNEIAIEIKSCDSDDQN